MLRKVSLIFLFQVLKYHVIFHLGYRTLCFAMTELDPEFYMNWMEEFKTSSTSLENREEKLAAVSEKVECNLQLVGVSAIEDKLQEVNIYNLNCIIQI
jgi:magnesium-transporting ATPase (P-type)